MHWAYRIYEGVGLAQAPVALGLHWVGLACACVVIRSTALLDGADDEYLRLGNHIYYAQQGCPAASVGNASGVHNHTARILAATSPLDATAAFSVAAVFATAMAAAFAYTARLVKDNDYEEHWDKALHDSAMTDCVGEGCLWAFVLSAAPAHAAVATATYETPEAVALRALARATSLALLCSLPRTPRSMPLMVVALFALFAEAIVSGEAACQPWRCAACGIQRFLDALLVVGYRWDVDPSPCVLWTTRLCYCTLSCVLLQASVAAAGSRI